VNNSVTVDGKLTKINAANLLLDPDMTNYDAFFIGDCNNYTVCQNIECLRFGPPNPQLFCTTVPQGPSFKTIFQPKGDKSYFFGAYILKTLGISCFACEA